MVNFEQVSADWVQYHLKRWLKYCEYRIKPLNANKRKFRADCKQAYRLSEPSHSFISVLKIAYSFPNFENLKIKFSVTLVYIIYKTLRKRYVLFRYNSFVQNIYLTIINRVAKK